MPKVKKVEGFNSMEQTLLETLADGEAHSIRELKELFWNAAKKHCKSVWESPGKAEFDAQAQSYVRNSIRRLVRDGWAEGPHMNENLPRGHYKLTKLGRERVRKGVTITPSAKKEKKKVAKKVTKKKVTKKAAAKKAPKKKVTKKKSPQEIAAKHRADAKKKKATKKAPKKKAPKKPPQKAKSKGNNKPKRKPAMLQKAMEEVKEKAEQTKKKAAKESAQEKAQQAQRRAAEEATAA